MCGRLQESFSVLLSGDVCAPQTLEEKALLFYQNLIYDCQLIEWKTGFLISCTCCTFWIHWVFLWLWLKLDCAWFVDLMWLWQQPCNNIFLTNTQLHYHFQHIIIALKCLQVGKLILLSYGNKTFCLLFTFNYFKDYTSYLRLVTYSFGRAAKQVKHSMSKEDHSQNNIHRF